jgi:hypothetical protein
MWGRGGDMWVMQVGEITGGRSNNGVCHIGHIDHIGHIGHMGHIRLFSYYFCLACFYICFGLIFS